MKPILILVFTLLLTGCQNIGGLSKQEVHSYTPEELTRLILDSQFKGDYEKVYSLFSSKDIENLKKKYTWNNKQEALSGMKHILSSQKFESYQITNCNIRKNKAEVSYKVPYKGNHISAGNRMISFELLNNEWQTAISYSVIDPELVFSSKIKNPNNAKKACDLLRSHNLHFQYGNQSFYSSPKDVSLINNILKKNKFIK